MGENIDENKKELFQEWTKIRELISNYDDRKHDLRKIGFSLITSLIAAQGILFGYFQSKNTTTQNIVTSLDLQGVITVVLGVTIALIFAVAYYEKGYRLFQEAAVQRAIILEKILNLQLTETISYQFKSWQSRVYEFGVYGIFMGAVLLLAYVTNAYFILLFILTSIGIIAMLILTRDRKEIYKTDVCCCLGVKIHWERLKGWVNCEKRIEDPHLDWSIYPVICKEDEKVAITLTNLNTDKSTTIFDNKTEKLKKDLKCENDEKVVFVKCENSNNKEKNYDENLLFKIVQEDVCQKYDCGNSKSKPKKACSETQCIQEVIDLHPNEKEIKETVFARKISNGFKLKAGASRTWLWDTTNMKKGIYIVYTPYNTPEILTRKIRII